MKSLKIASVGLICVLAFFFNLGDFGVQRNGGGSATIPNSVKYTDTLFQFDVMKYGAKGDGATNDAVAVQAAIDAAKANHGGVVYFRKLCLVSTTLNVTACEGITFRAEGKGYATPFSGLRFATTGTPGLDVTGSAHITFEDMYFDNAAGAAAPNVGILLARQQGNGSGIGHVDFYNCTYWGNTTGKVCKALVYDNGCEVVNFFGTRLIAQADTTKALVFTSVNDYSITSAFVTTDSTGFASSSVLTYVGGTLADYSAGRGDTSASCVYLHNTQQVSFIGTWFSSNATQFIKVLSNVQAHPNVGLSVDACRFEPYASQNPKFGVYGIIATNVATDLAQFKGVYGTVDSAVIRFIGAANSVLTIGSVQGNRFSDSPPTYMIDAPAPTLFRGGEINAEGLLMNVSYWQPAGTFVTNLGAGRRATLNGGFESPSLAIADSVIDCSKATNFTKTIGASERFLLSNMNDGDMVNVAITASGSYTCTWVTSVTWRTGSAPTQTASKTDIYTFFKLGTTIYASASQNY